jgi:hypothetical protein
MTLPAFSAHASLYRATNHYRSFVADVGNVTTDQSVVAAYVPGPGTQQRCDDCLHPYKVGRDICLAKTAWMVASLCGSTGIFTFGLGCAGAIALGLQQAAGCEAVYLTGEGICHIPGGSGSLTGRCCPKVCGVHIPEIPGSGCCDHGETCKGLGMRGNTRDGCCPVGQDCGSVCCAPNEKCCGDVCCPSNYYCLDNRCSEHPGTFANTPPPTPPGDNLCYFFAGGSPCGSKCCYGGLQCCGVEPNGQPRCQVSCVR